MKHISLFIFLALFNFLPAQALLDSTFATNGHTQNDNFSGEASCIAVQPDGKIVLGLNDVNSQRYFYLARYNADGSQDTTFGTNGKTSIFVLDDAEIQEIAIRPDGKILAAGHADYCNDIICGFDNLIVTRFLPNGERDTTFADFGILRSGPVFGPLVMGAKGMGMTVLSNGQILISGSLIMQNSQGGMDFSLFLARLNSDGSLDNTFGPSGNGLVKDGPPGVYELWDMTVDASGNLYFASDGLPPSGIPGSGTDIYVHKMSPSGQMDTSFGTGGYTTWDMSLYDRVEAITVRPDGKILVGGRYYPASSLSIPDTGYVTILEPDGQLSPLMNGNHIQIHTYKPQVSITSLEAMPDNRVLIGGFTDSLYVKAVGFVGRLNVDGSLDTSFTGTGSALDYYEYGQYSTFRSGAFVNSVYPLSNGQVIAAGYYNPLVQNIKQAVLLMRLSPVGLTSRFEAPALESGLSIFPNPANDAFRIRPEDGWQKEEVVQIIDLQGGIVQTFHPHGPELSINLQTPGLYLVHTTHHGTGRVWIE